MRLFRFWETFFVDAILEPNWDKVRRIQWNLRQNISSTAINSFDTFAFIYQSFFRLFNLQNWKSALHKLIEFECVVDTHQHKTFSDKTERLSKFGSRNQSQSKSYSRNQWYKGDLKILIKKQYVEIIKSNSIIHLELRHKRWSKKLQRPKIT